MTELTKKRPEFRNINAFKDLTTYRLPLAGWVSILHRASGGLMFILLPLIVWLFDTSVYWDLYQLDAGGETGGLVIGRGFDQTQILDVAHQRGHTVVAQAARVDARRNEGAAQRVHFHQRRQVAGVAEVVGIGAAG